MNWPRIATGPPRWYEEVWIRHCTCPAPLLSSRQHYICRNFQAFWNVMSRRLVNTVQLKCDGTRWRTGGEVKGKLANGVGSQYSSHYLGTWCIQMMRTPRLPAVDWTDALADLNGLVRFVEKRNLVSARVPSNFKLASTTNSRLQLLHHLDQQSKNCLTLKLDFQNKDITFLRYVGNCLPGRLNITSHSIWIFSKIAVKTPNMAGNNASDSK
jgi:hypothetical protein